MRTLLEPIKIKQDYLSAMNFKRSNMSYSMNVSDCFPNE